jgi:hypothetical protein
MYKIFYYKYTDDIYYYISNFKDKAIAIKFRHVGKLGLRWYCYKTDNMIMAPDGKICALDNVLSELKQSSMNPDSPENAYRQLIWVLL